MKREGRISTYGMDQAETGTVFTIFACKRICCFVCKDVSKSTQNSRLKLWFDSENESFNPEFMWNTILITVNSILIKNYKVGAYYQTYSLKMFSLLIILVH
jgi:hypothetical protein